jgi:hypothetical protein
MLQHGDDRNRHVQQRLPQAALGLVGVSNVTFRNCEAAFAVSQKSQIGQLPSSRHCGNWLLPTVYFKRDIHIDTYRRKFELLRSNATMCAGACSAGSSVRDNGFLNLYESRRVGILNPRDSVMSIN